MRRRGQTMGSGSSSASSSSSPSRNLEGNAEKLRRILTDVQSFLVEAEKKIVEKESDKHLVRELWKIYYDAEDALRDHAESQISGSTGGCALPTCSRKRKQTESRVEPSISPNPCSPCIEDAVSQVVKDFENFSKTWKALRLPMDNRKPAAQVRQPTGSYSIQEEIYSFKEDIDYIVDLVGSRSSCMKCLDSSYGDAGEKNLIILPVIGAAGTGKTTLVQKVFHDERIPANYFGKKAWVSCVSNQGNVLQLLNSVLEAVGGKSVSGQISVAQDRIRGKLKNQRLFLVLDDACATNSDFWETFWSTIANPVLEGSVAMVIAQKYQVLEAMPSYLPRIESYNLYPLTFDDCWSIFKATIASSSRSPNCFAFKDEDDVFTKIGKQIVKKYQGFPGTIKHAARQLSNSSDIDHWEGHLNTNSFGSYYSISFHQLTHRAKRCLRYCCLFPEGHLFDRDYLIRLWTAEEFVAEGKYGERGADCFKELLNKFFLLHRGDKYEIPTVVLDILRDSDFFTRIDSKNAAENSSFEKRHISFVGRETEAHPSQNPRTLLHLRSFLVFFCTVPENMNFFQYMGHLRTLELSCSQVKILPDSIGCLRNLCFLGLNWTLIEVIPDSVGTLQHLRFLGLNGTLIEALPDSICTLTNLLALELESCNNLCGLPKGLNKLTNLQTLPVFKVSECNGQYSGLQELAELVNLRNELSILGLQFHHVSNEKLRVSLLGKMQSLKSLKLCWFSSPSDEPEHHHSRLDPAYSCSQHYEVLESLQPHINLENLTIHSYRGGLLPKWIACQSLKKMKFINLKDCINCQSLPSLGRLPMLKRLVINCPQVGKIDGEFCGGYKSFPSLEDLVLIGMSKLEEWTGVGKDDFLVLKELECIGCPRLVQIPEIASLKKLKMDKCEKVAISPGFSSVEDLQICATICSELAELTSLVHLSLMHCQGPVHLSKLPQLKYLWVEDCEGLKLGDGIKLSYLDALFVANCPHDIVLPKEMKQPPYSHFEDDHTLNFEKNLESSD